MVAESRISESAVQGAISGAKAGVTQSDMQFGERPPLQESVERDSGIALLNELPVRERYEMWDRGEDTRPLGDPVALKAAIKSMNEPVDETLSLQELAQVEAIQAAVLTGDAATLLKELKNFEGNPKAAEKIMQAVIKGLEKAGIQADWDYSMHGAFGKRGDGNAGYLSISVDNKDGTFTVVSFSTNGDSAGLRTNIPTKDGRIGMFMPSPVNPAEGLLHIVNRSRN